jgi:hypothetical protein
MGASMTEASCQHPSVLRVGLTAALLLAVVQSSIDKALEPLTRLQDISSRGFLAMTYHTPNDAPTPPQPGPTPPPANDNRDAFCAFLEAWPGPQSSGIAPMGAEGLAMVEQLWPITPPEMADEVTTLQTFYAAATNMDFEAIGTNADPFGIAWNSIFAHCGLTPPTPG